MTFTSDQTKLLASPLERKHVRSRQQAGRSLSYLEGWHCIAEANRIFGFDAWDRETLDLRECGEPRQVDGKWRVSFMCRVRVTVRPAAQLDPQWWVKRDGTGYGSGIDKDLGQAYESAIKEAETDAMKRSLMTFGNPFGLALYNKDQTDVVDGPSDDDIARDEYVESCKVFIRGATDPQALRTWWASEDQKRARRDFGLTQAVADSLMAMLSDRLQALAPRAA